MTVLAIALSAVGWLVLSTLSASEQARQRATASSLIEQVDALLQNNIPSMTCANAATYVAGAGSGNATRNGTISVMWHPATNTQTTTTLSNSLEVQC